MTLGVARHKLRVRLPWGGRADWERTTLDTTALLLVIASALLHAIWNLLLKGAGDRVAFVWWYLLIPMILFAPVALALSGGTLGPMPAASLACGLVSGVLQAAALLAMAWAYGTGDLSVAYPLSRGSAQVLIVILGVALYGEVLSAIGIAGLVLVFVGVYVVFLPSWSRAHLVRPVRQLFSAPSSRAALLAGLTIALYHVLDKRGVLGASKYQYILLLFAADFCTVTVFLFFRRRWHLVWAEWRANRLNIIVAGSLSLISYLLVLFALSRERVAYVGPARNVGIVFSVLLGAILLKERHGRMRVLGSALIVMGLVVAGAGG